MKIGFIGLGNMGGAIARNLIAAGHTLTVHNRTRSRAEPFEALGARVAAGPGEAAADADVLVTMLADDDAVERAILAPGEAIRSLPAGAIHVSMSTISVALSRRLATDHAQHDQHYIAAPVFGRPDAAAAAKLFVVAAGPAAQVELCRPIFDAIGQKTFPAGEDAPAANVVKLAGNFLITTLIESVAEACALVRKSGLDAERFLDVLTGTLFPAPIYRNYGHMIATDSYEPVGFKLPLGMKDNRLLLEAAGAVAVPMPMASLIRDRYLTAIARGLGEADWAAIARVSFQEAGL